MTFPRGAQPNHHHIDDDVVARRLQAEDEERGVVLALGGGFSRGFAHLGVMDVLDQEQIPVCAIVGTSIGALLGAAYADGICLRDVCDLGRRVNLRDFIRFGESDTGASRRDCIGEFTRKWFTVTTVEDLRIPTTIVTTDLGTGEPYLITRGPLEGAIRASCAFPGLFKPVEYLGRLLADGCIVAPVPTAIATGISGGCVLGVAVEPAEHVGPLEKEASGCGRAVKAYHTSAEGTSWAHADMMLEPEVQHIDWSDFSRVNEAFAAGAESMRRALPSLRELLARRSWTSPSSPVSIHSNGSSAQ